MRFSLWFVLITALCLLLPASSMAHSTSGQMQLPSGRIVFDGHQSLNVDSSSSAVSRARPSQGFVIGGPRWRKSTLYYYTNVRGQYVKGVQMAVNEWNARRMGITLRKTNNRRKADFTITVDRKISPGGLATVGYYPGHNWVKLNMQGYMWPDIAWVTSHELGHIFGLGHSRGCAVMSYSAYTSCKWPANTPWNWRCRLQEKDDLNGIKRLYGKRFKLRPNIFCLKNPAAAPIQNLTAQAGDRTFIADLTWTPSARAKQYYVSRSTVNGPCPTNWVSNYQAVKTTSYREPIYNYDTPVPGNYCFSVWSVNIDGYPAGRKSFQVTYQPPLPPSVTSLMASITNQGWGNTVTLNWVNPPGITNVRILRSDVNGPCLSDLAINDYHEVYVSYSDIQMANDTPIDASYNTIAGTYCYSVFASDDGKTYSAMANTAIAFVP